MQCKQDLQPASQPASQLATQPDCLDAMTGNRPTSTPVAGSASFLKELLGDGKVPG